MLATLLAGCASVSVYDGPNAGYAVTSIAARSNTMFQVVGLHFRRRGSGDDRGRLWFGTDALSVGPKQDFSTVENRGFVGSLRLAATMKFTTSKRATATHGSRSSRISPSRSP
jgi:hypothetical protein